MGYQDRGPRHGLAAAIGVLTDPNRTEAFFKQQISRRDFGKGAGRGIVYAAGAAAILEACSTGGLEDSARDEAVGILDCTVDGFAKSPDQSQNNPYKWTNVSVVLRKKIGDHVYRAQVVDNAHPGVSFTSSMIIHPDYDYGLTGVNASASCESMSAYVTPSTGTTTKLGTDGHTKFGISTNPEDYTLELRGSSSKRDPNRKVGSSVDSFVSGMAMEPAPEAAVGYTRIFDNLILTPWYVAQSGASIGLIADDPVAFKKRGITPTSVALYVDGMGIDSLTGTQPHFPKGLVKPWTSRNIVQMQVLQQVLPGTGPEKDDIIGRLAHSVKPNQLNDIKGFLGGDNTRFVANITGGVVLPR